ncbi:UvrABC system protein C [Alphaproteobacteria bacterium]|nr:UvrABC system protein C [Alphaproteobacteria bacterium]
MEKKLEHIAEIIRAAAKYAGLAPGVYKMINENGTAIYVGKAKHLKNRLLSYTRFAQMPNRLKMMVSNIYSIKFITTNSEIEAFILESNLIKQFKPFYNILLKDDKTFPYIVFGESDEFKRVFKYRTTTTPGNNFFGPYPASGALDEALKIVQKIFLLRGCTDNYFKNRKRPCLQYFIKRCSAPCVGKISAAEYAKNVELAMNLLKGKDEIVRKSLVQKMREFSENFEFEQAAMLRDRIKAISEIQSKQYIQIDDETSIDFVALAKGAENSIVFVSFYRTGKNVGAESFSIQNNMENSSESEIISSFIIQFYANVPKPSVIVTSHILEDNAEICELFLKQYEANVKIICGRSGVYKKIIESCLNNAKIKLNKADGNEYKKQLNDLAKLVQLTKIDRIETYDNSHIQGTNACGIMVVFEDGKLRREKYRKFNIDEKTANSGDDISMMKFVLQKRFNSNKIHENPDLLIIDGGKTQVAAVALIIAEFDKQCALIGIAKQNDRKIGDEKVVFPNGDELSLGKDDDLLNFLIMLRNEAHKEAISFHRKKRSRSLSKSELDNIRFIGATRKKMLLEHFGSIENIKKASIDDLQMVKGFNKQYSKAVFDFFNSK